MRIKLDPMSKDEYIRAGDMWVRNFTKQGTKFVDLNNNVKQDDYFVIINNEMINKTLGHQNIAEEPIVAPDVCIVSDGYDFLPRHRLLALLPNVIVLAVNGTLAKWELMLASISPNMRKPINGYVVNNPYEECSTYLPKKHKYFPTCIASVRTNIDFLKKYKGDVYFYEPTPEKGFGMEKKEHYYIDDYRNPICAALGLAHRFNAKRVMLLCCDHCFVEERPGAKQLKNGFWTYPQHYISQQVIDANLFWLTHQENRDVKAANYSNGLECQNAEYISSIEQAVEFFQDK